MAEKPILFSAPMVRAIMEGRKTQTRRIAKLNASGRIQRGGKQWHIEDIYALFGCPYGQPGDSLWMKETHAVCPNCGTVNYRATVNRPRNCSGCDETVGKWKPSIFMRREHSRVLLPITDVRLENLNDITPADAIAEGIERVTSVGHFRVMGWRNYGGERDGFLNPVDSYRTLLEAINGPGSWAANPLVWSVGFNSIYGS